MKNGKLITLGIETSCDETAVAVTANGRAVLSNIISSQIDVHEVFGGVVPEIASRHHLTQINAVMDAAISEADVTWRDIDLIGATCGPGLVGAVLIGLSTAKAVAYAASIPFVGVHHIRGHISASYLDPLTCPLELQDTLSFKPGTSSPGATADAGTVPFCPTNALEASVCDVLDYTPPCHAPLEPPHLALVVSGGHTDLVDVRAYDDYILLGHTRDDAVGEAFDKVARVLGLGYPGGPKVDESAKRGDVNAVAFKRVLLEDGSLDFSFSGIKTAVLNHVNTVKQSGGEINVPDIAASFEASVVDVIAEKTGTALRRTGYKKLSMGGGVAANSMLRERISLVCAAEGAELFVPPSVYCTDNAAMIACAAYYQYRISGESPLNLDAHATLSL